MPTTINVSRLLRRLLNGDLELIVQSRGIARKRGRKPGPKPAGDVEKKIPRKVGRPRKSPTPISEPKPRGRKKLPSLPSVRDVCLFLMNKINGEKLRAICSHFGVKRDRMKPYLTKLIGNGAISFFKGAYYPVRRLRGISPKQEKQEPVPEKTIIAALEKNPGLTMSELAATLGEKTYHRLIKPVGRLKKRGTVTITAGKYALAEK